APRASLCFGTVRSDCAGYRAGKERRCAGRAQLASTPETPRSCKNFGLRPPERRPRPGRMRRCRPRLRDSSSSSLFERRSRRVRSWRKSSPNEFHKLSNEFCEIIWEFFGGWAKQRGTHLAQTLEGLSSPYPRPYPRTRMLPCRRWYVRFGPIADINHSARAFKITS